MNPIYHGYVTRVNLYKRAINTGDASEPRPGRQIYAGDFDDVSDHSRSGHRTDQTQRPACLGPGGRGADAARPGGVRRRLRRGERAAVRAARGGGHLQEARREEEAELVPGAVRPVRRGARGVAHLHLFGARDRRRSHQQLDGPGRDARHHDRPVPRLHARTHDVRGAVLHGPARRRRSQARRGDHRLRVRRRVDAHDDADGQGGAGQDRRRRLLRQGAALDRRPAGAGPGGRAVAVQRHQVHQPLPGDPRDLELRLGLRRQRAAGQEVLLAAHRVGDGARRGLARRAHADPQADLPGEQVVLHRRGVPVGVRQDQPRDAAADGSRLARRDHRRRHRVDAVRQGRPARMRSTPSSASSASRPAPTGSPTRTR